MRYLDPAPLRVRRTLARRGRAAGRRLAQGGPCPGDMTSCSRASPASRRWSPPRGAPSWASARSQAPRPSWPTSRPKRCGWSASCWSGRWRPGGYVTIQVRDPKPRMVSAAPFRDRVVHHALCHVVATAVRARLRRRQLCEPEGQGHPSRARCATSAIATVFAHVLRCDIHRYFAAIDHAILKRDLRRRLACERTLRLCDIIIDGSNAQEPVELYFPGDDLFAPFERRRGLPIGNLTSQFFANLVPRSARPLRQGGAAGAGLRPATSTTSRCSMTTPPCWPPGATASAGSSRVARLVLSAAKTAVAPTRAPATFLGFVTGAGPAPAARGQRPTVPQPAARSARSLARRKRRVR